MVIIFLLGYPAVGHSQSPDSLNQWVSENLRNNPDTEHLKQISLQALHVSKELMEKEMECEALRNLSLFHEYYGSVDSAIYYMERVRDIYQTLHDTTSLAETYLEIKLLLGSKAEYDRAAEQVFAALELYEKSGDQRGIANCYVELCDLLYYEDKYQESVDYCDRAIEIQKEIDAREDLAKALRFKASSQLFSGADLEEALATINEAIELYQSMEGKEIELMASKNGRGNILKYLGRYDEALADYKSNYEKCLEIGFKPYIIPSVANIGHVYKLQGKFREALPYTLKSIELMKESGDNKNLWENYMHARDIYAHLGNFEKAYEYSVLYSDQYNEYQQTIIHRLESEAQIKYETAKKDAQISEQETRIEQQDKIKFLYLSIAILLIISLIGMLQSRYRLRKKQKEIEHSKEELEKSLENLKVTQNQLIHAEKMASLGELTAGIAHEIQNPLNFITNFSEINEELIRELIEELDKGRLQEAKALAVDITENEQKIHHHGKRADAIVKGMLQHSRTSSGQKEPVDINSLADEYLRLSYHGLRAKYKSFNAGFRLEADPDLPEVNAVSQDIGRVLLNLINNAFHAVYERSKAAGADYKPEVVVVTKKEGNKIEIRVRDNGTGIPDEIREKIFQPFFTTKPAGEGTGLGLSLSYDIITRGHGGKISVDTTEGEGTEFIITLPLKSDIELK
ncbi:MAG: hypothetical protein Kow00127_20970 [Bacteroidales bacterium]